MDAGGAACYCEARICVHSKRQAVHTPFDIATIRHPHYPQPCCSVATSSGETLGLNTCISDGLEQIPLAAGHAGGDDAGRTLTIPLLRTSLSSSSCPRSPLRASLVDARGCFADVGSRLLTVCAHCLQVTSSPRLPPGGLAQLPKGAILVDRVRSESDDDVGDITSASPGQLGVGGVDAMLPTARTCTQQL